MGKKNKQSNNNQPTVEVVEFPLAVEAVEVVEVVEVVEAVEVVEVETKTLEVKNMPNVYICSKIPNNNIYTLWSRYDKVGNGLPRKERSVLIKGGAGVANKNFITPYGVVTKITADEFKLISDPKICPSFLRHVDKGYLKVLDNDPREDAIRKMSEKMQEDKSAPITPEQLKKEGKDAGATGKVG